MAEAASGPRLKVRQSLQSGTRHILNHTTWCRSGGQFLPWARCYRLESVKNPRQDPANISRCNAVFLSPSQCIGR